MSKGKGPALTKGQKWELLEKKVQNMEMSVKVNQMMLKQTGNIISPMQNDLHNYVSKQRELQYRVLAIQELLNLNIDDLEDKSMQLQIRDFEETSDKEDLEKKYEIADIITENSVVIVSTTTPDIKPDVGILRSKLTYSDISVPGFKEGILGKKVGDTVDANIQGTKHTVEILGIRSVPKLVQSEDEAIVETVASSKKQAKKDVVTQITNG